MKLTTVINWGGVNMQKLTVRWSRQPLNRSVLRTELANLLANIKCDETVLEGMYRSFRSGTGGCCVGCTFGDAYRKVYNRLKRRVERVNQITFKLWRDSGVAGCAPRPHWSEWL